MTKIIICLSSLLCASLAWSNGCDIRKNIIHNDSTQCRVNLFSEKYEIALKYSTGKDRELLIRHKNNLENEVKNECLDDPECKKTKYSQYTTELSRITAKYNGRVTTEASAQKVFNGLRTNMKALGINTTNMSCHSYVSLSQSYGAICNLENNKTVLVCDNFMVGKFTLKSSGFSLNIAQVYDFTVSSCPYGG